jgi:hypothetical protein
MHKILMLVVAGSDTHSDLGRTVNAMEVTKEFHEAGDDVAIVFDGAGTTWIPELENPEHRRHELWMSVRSVVAGACSFCSFAFGVKDEVEASGIPLLDEYDHHPSVRGWVAKGYQVLTF